MTEHTSKNYEEELNDLQTRVMSMGGRVEALLAAAVEVYDLRDLERARAAVEAAREVRSDWLSAEHLITEVIALRQPAAKDLRLLLSFIRTLSDLKRIAKQAGKIAKSVLRRAPSGTLPRINGIVQAGATAKNMLRGALDAINREDADLARFVIGSDRLLDEQYETNMRLLITHMMEDPRTIGAAIDVLWVIKAIERVGDYAENIAEAAIYIVEGEDVRARDGAGGKNRGAEEEGENAG